MRNKLVCGVGINDTNYVVKPTVNGKRKVCPFYLAWRNMLARCYDAKFQVGRPTYIGGSVCEDWLTFSKFKSWMETQSWQGNQLDKDILVEGNKICSPKTCVFVDAMTNTFIIDCGAARGEWPIGVYFIRKFRAQCRNPFTKKNEYLGSFTCPNEAHLAWRKRKHQLAIQLADLQTDNRVATKLREMYTTYKDAVNVK